jgi:hypothetical protein
MIFDPCPFDIDGTRQIAGTDDATGNQDFAVVFDETAGLGFNACVYSENTPSTLRLLVINADEVASCQASIAAECADRGF